MGAGAGALAGSASDYGINDDFMRSVAQQMTPDSSAIFMLVTKITPDKVLTELSKFGGTILRTSFTQDVEAKWQAALSEAEVSNPRAA